MLQQERVSGIGASPTLRWVDVAKTVLTIGSAEGRDTPSEQVIVTAQSSGQLPCGSAPRCGSPHWCAEPWWAAGEAPMPAYA